MSLSHFVSSLCLAVTLLATAMPAADQFPKPFNTQTEGQHPPTAQEMLGLIQLPAGFQVTLFAGDPDVQQPICMDFDDRGRLWVAENYSYSGGPYETKLRDRIIVLEDRDGDGQHDSRKVFWDQGFMLTSLTWGFGGVWFLHDGTLSFLADKDGDAVPDGPPQVMLDGWSKECGHNFVSGLTWGPDGWLYGRHGIVDTSYPGVPGSPQSARPRMNCGIWRYHPVTRSVEVVCNGTTNPWGLDYNTDGQFFMTNNVQGHLWHVIPGAHYQRMYGQDFNPHAYELMDMTADHYHWDIKTKWNESRDGVANDFGGGHSHVGGMIYHGENFPKQYHGQIFMCNTHGRRMNVNRLEKQGSGYVGKREPDFMKVNTPWFRGVDIKLGPEGGMYVSDWSDYGECHDHDGVHRTSGRIYRITYGKPETITDYSQRLKVAALDKFDWWGRHARRLLQEAQVNGQMVASDLERARAVGGISGLLLRESLGLNDKDAIDRALVSKDSIVVAAAVHMAASTAERRVTHRLSLQRLASATAAPNVLLALVGSVGKFPAADQWLLLKSMLAQPQNAIAIAEENNLTLMTWYALEPHASEPQALELVQSIPKLEQFVVRRRAHDIDNRPSLAGETLAAIASRSGSTNSDKASRIIDLLSAFKVGLAGRARVSPPKNWAEVETKLRSLQDPGVASAVDGLAALFGNGAALEELRKLAGNASADAVAREQAILALAQAKDNAAVPMLFNLLNDRAVGDTAIEALKGFDHPDTPQQLLKRLNGFKDGNKARAIDTLASRLSYATKLIEAIEDKRVDAHELTAAQVRQLRALNDKHIDATLESSWGVVQDTPQARIDAIEKWKKSLTPDVIAKGNKERGAELFKKNCANCHKLYGEGQAIAPDLTGANRSSLEYLLINIIDPSAVVPKQFTTSVVALKEGRVITGVVVSQTDNSVVLQTDKEQVTIAKEEIETIRNTGKSLMPDGMLDTLSQEQVRDLFRFVMP